MATAIPKTQYASAGPLALDNDSAAATTLPRIAVVGLATVEHQVPTGETQNVRGVRAPRALFSNVHQADIAALLAAHQAIVLIDLHDTEKASYLFDSNDVVLCTSRDQFLALADRAISFPADSKIAASIARSASGPLKTKEGVDPKQLASATATLVWTNSVDAAILQVQREAAAALNIPFDRVAATRGTLELSDGRFSRYRIVQLQLTDDRLVQAKE